MTGGGNTMTDPCLKRVNEGLCKRPLGHAGDHGHGMAAWETAFAPSEPCQCFTRDGMLLTYNCSIHGEAFETDALDASYKEPDDNGYVWSDE